MPTEESYLNESLRKIAKGAGFVLIGTIIGRAFGYDSRLIIARLGASDYGLVALDFAVMSIVVLLLLGFGALSAAWGWVLAIIVMPFLALYFLEKMVFPIFKTKVKAVSVDKELFSFLFPLLFAGIAGLVMGLG